MEQNKEALELLESAEKALQSSGQDREETKVRDIESAEKIEQSQVNKKSPRNIDEAMIVLTRKLSNVNFSKDGKNPIFKSGYLTVDNLLKVLNPILADIGLNIQQNPEGDEEVHSIQIGNNQFKAIQFLKMRTIITFVNGDGEVSYKEFLSFPQAVELKSNGNLSQQMGSAITYMRRYHLTSILCIGTGEDDDANSMVGSPVNETITKKQENILEVEIKQASERSGMDYKQLIAAIIQEYHIPSLSKLRVSDFDDVINKLKLTK